MTDGTMCRVCEGPLEPKAVRVRRSKVCSPRCRTLEWRKKNRPRLVQPVPHHERVGGTA